MINKLLFLCLMLIAGSVLAADTYVSQTATGNGSGADAKNCKAISSVAWAGKVHLVGTVSSSITINGSSTLVFEPDAKLQADHFNKAAITVGADGVVIDGGQNGLIEATGQNTTSGVSSAGVAIYQHSNLEVKNLKILNVYRKTTKADLAHAAGTAVDLKYGSNFHIHDCTLQGQGAGIFYTYTAGASSSNIELDHNTISDGNWGIGSGSGGNDAVVDGYKVHDNDISMPGPIWDDPQNDNHHNGIYIWAAQPGSKIKNLKIYNNYVHGDAGEHSTAFIYVSANESGSVSVGLEGVLLYNNLIEMTTHGASNGGIFPSCNGASVYNNTIVATGPEGGLGIRQYTGSIPGTWGKIQNNIIFHFMTTIYSVGGAADLTMTNNLENVDPKFVGVDNFELTSASPAKGKGIDLASFFTTDIDGVTRTSPWDIGAYAYAGGGNPTPTPPGTPTPAPSSTPRPSATPRPTATPMPTATPPTNETFEQWIEDQNSWIRSHPPQPDP